MRTLDFEIGLRTSRADSVRTERICGSAWGEEEERANSAMPMRDAYGASRARVLDTLEGVEKYQMEFARMAMSKGGGESALEGDGRDSR